MVKNMCFAPWRSTCSHFCKLSNEIAEWKGSLVPQTRQSHTSIFLHWIQIVQLRDFIPNLRTMYFKFTKCKCTSPSTNQHKEQTEKSSLFIQMT